MVEPARDPAQEVAHRKWAVVLLILVSTYALGLGAWPTPDTLWERLGGVLAGHGAWLSGAHLLAGVLGFTAVLLSIRWPVVGKILAAVSGLLLLSALFGFRAFSVGAVLIIVLPAALLLLTSPFVGPMPTLGEERGRR